MENKITIKEKDLRAAVYWLRVFGMDGSLINDLESQLGIKLHNIVTGIDDQCRVDESPSFLTISINGGSPDYRNTAYITLKRSDYNDFVRYLSKFVDD
jgi:hypothetical protein